jgi:hypothetical protein
LVFALAASTAQAGIVITFDRAVQIAQPGDLLQFTGTIANTGPDEVFLNTDPMTPPVGDFTLIDQFFANVPISLLGNTDSGPIDLFDIQVGNPPYGLYTGEYVLKGGADSNADDLLAVAGFAVEVVPEPGTVGLLGIAGIAGIAYRRLRRR